MSRSVLYCTGTDVFTRYILMAIPQALFHTLQGIKTAVLDGSPTQLAEAVGAFISPLSGIVSRTGITLPLAVVGAESESFILCANVLATSRMPVTSE